MLRGTYRRDRHGDLPPGARVLPMPPARTLPLTADSSLSAPGPLSAAEKQKWDELVARFPHLRVGHIDSLWAYVSAWTDWTFYRGQLAALGGGTHLMKDGRRIKPSPYVDMARDALAIVTRYGEILGFTGTREGRTIVREQSKLQKFLAAKARPGR